MCHLDVMVELPTMRPEVSLGSCSDRQKWLPSNRFSKPCLQGKLLWPLALRNPWAWGVSDLGFTPAAFWFSDSDQMLVTPPTWPPLEKIKIQGLQGRLISSSSILPTPVNFTHSHVDWTENGFEDVFLKSLLGLGWRAVTPTPDLCCSNPDLVWMSYGGWTSHFYAIC